MIERLIGFLAALLFAVAGLGQPVLAEFVAPAEECCSVAPGSTPTVRHYTTTEAAEAIAKGGEILPGPSSGRIWVTTDEYVDAAITQSRLALPNTPDGYFEFPLCRVDCPSPPSVVEPWGGHPGGGIEITTTSPIDVSDIPFVPFGAR